MIIGCVFLKGLDCANINCVLRLLQTTSKHKKKGKDKFAMPGDTLLNKAFGLKGSSVCVSRPTPVSPTYRGNQLHSYSPLG